MAATGGGFSSSYLPRKSKAEMVAALKGGARQAKLAARNTLDYVGPDGRRRIRLHSTDILTFPKAGGFIVDTGGWNTHTTRGRLNDYLPEGYRVFTSKGRIHLSAPGGAIPFRSRISVLSNGTIRADWREGRLAARERALAAFMAAWKERGLRSADDSRGDPWVLPVPGSQGKIPEATVMDWIRTRYVFRSFYAYALAYAGLQPEGVSYTLADCDREGGKLDARALRRIRRYARACIGLEA